MIENLVTGIFKTQSNDYYKFLYNNHSIEMQEISEKNPISLFEDEKIPLWILRHSLGKPGELEALDRILITPKKNYLHYLERGSMLYSAMLDSENIRNLDYKGISLELSEDEYSHAVGPIHAGIIEPGHFRFIVRGEEIQSLYIRLGFQKRNILQKLQNFQIHKTFPILESVSGDSTIAYGICLSQIIEKSLGIQVTDSVKLMRLILLELERIAIHIGDIGAIGSDIGYYPILGLCATDRGVALGFMELLTGSRFGRGSASIGNLLLNKECTLADIKQACTNLQKAVARIEAQFQRIRGNSTIRERTYECGQITKDMVLQNGFVGMAARCTGLLMDLRQSEPLYNSHSPLHLELPLEEMNGDVWARWYLRFWEMKNSTNWLLSVIEEAYSNYIKEGPASIIPKKYNSGIFYSTVEGWRGPVLVAMKINEKGIIQDTYIRDPSIPNWHALEIAVRGELIGDFPLNNKSFNLSYAGSDL